MAASTANRTGVDIDAGLRNLSLPVAASTHIYAGSIVCTNAAGNTVPGSDTAALVYAGIANSEADNSAGIAGAVRVEVIPPAVSPFIKFDATSPTIAWHNVKVYIIDDHTVALTGSTSNAIVAGTCVECITTGTSGKVLVDTSKRS